MKEARTFLFHRSRLHQESISRLLRSTEFRIGAASTEIEAETGEGPDLVLMDLPSLRSSFGSFRAWCASPAKVVLVVDEFYLNDLRLALRLGVDGYLLNRLSPNAFVLSLRMVMAGEKVFPSELSKEIFSKEFKRSVSKAPEGESDEAFEAMDTGLGLQQRDLRILDMIAHGVGNRAIAGALQVTEDLVKMYVRQIMKRIQVNNRTQAAIWAVQHGVARRAPELAD